MAESHHSPEVSGVDRVIHPKKDCSLYLAADSLVISDRLLTKRSQANFCGWRFGSSTTKITIPYYNILWASVDKELVIEWAQEDDDKFYKRKNPDSKLNYVKMHYPVGEDSTLVLKWAEKLLQLAYGRAHLQKRALVLVNPKAGPGKAVEIFEQDVRPLFEAARMRLTVRRTSRGGEGMDICRNLDITDYDVVVVCSGDGLAYEVFNGFGARRDAGIALKKVAVAHIPCGSGNALGANLNGFSHPSPSALAIIKGIPTPIDLMSVTQGTQRTLSFLSQSVGIIAECDLGTENMRWLGAKRFDVGIVQRIWRKRLYPCDVAFKLELDDKDDIKSHYRDYQARVAEGDKPSGDDTQRPSSSRGGTQGGLPPLRFGTVHDEVPDDWEKHNFDKMGSFYCGKMPYMTAKACFFPAACPEDGLMDVAMNDGDIRKRDYIPLMQSVESGNFFDNPLLSYRKVAAYRFTPRNQPTGYISIDGERVPFEPFQVEVHSGLGTVLSRRGRYECNGPPDWERVA
ncbi:sphingoid long chain base kinase-like protein [Poronia punctata]|nr:sphingoid long chain base kinase-like protein [Poronia punctata]